MAQTFQGTKIFGKNRMGRNIDALFVDELLQVADVDIGTWRDVEWVRIALDETPKHTDCVVRHDGCGIDALWLQVGFFPPCNVCDALC